MDKNFKLDIQLILWLQKNICTPICTLYHPISLTLTLKLFSTGCCQLASKSEASWPKFFQNYSQSNREPSSQKKNILNLLHKLRPPNVTDQSLYLKAGPVGLWLYIHMGLDPYGS